MVTNAGIFTVGLSPYHDMMKDSPKGRPLAKGAGRRPARVTRAVAGDAFDGRSWAGVPAAFRANRALPPPWRAIFESLRHGTADDLVVVGQFGQSIDARIATAGGHSHYINGAAGLAHLHRLRALVDAVVIGIGTATADDPQLTVRRVAGPNPARVVIDPNGRLSPTSKVLAGDGIHRLVLTAKGTRTHHPAGVEIVRLPRRNGHIAPADILAALAARGFRRILIEGGADTVSRFLAAGCLDRLHVVIAPIIIGAGPASVTLPPIARLEQALRAPMRSHVLGDEVLLDCDLSAQRIAVGVAKKSK
jgi:diaminohydroxyphosphoribosylaminopyrimidine deaminase/5-amino-6-(5-phosphoribosylamino)uracil reductase